MIQAIGKNFLPIATYVGIFVFIYGIHDIGTYHQVLLAGNPFERLDTVNLQYLHGSPLGPIIAHYLGLWMPGQLFIFYASLVALCVWAVHSYLRKFSHSSGNRYLLLATVIALSPLLHVLVSWVGISDPLLVLGYIWFISSRSLVVKNGAIFFMLLAHFQQGILVLAVHAILNLKKEHLKRAYVYATGVLLGGIAYGLYHFAIGETLSREEYLVKNLSEFLSAPNVMLSVLFAFSWFSVVIGYQFYRERNPRLLVAVVLIITVVIFTIDRTRVGAMLSLPLYFAAVRFFSDQPLPNRKILWALLLLSVIQMELNGLTLSSIHESSLLLGV
jgi:hypothetical protein